MQEQEFGVFDSKDGDRKYSAADFTGFYADFYRNGIVADDTSYLQVMANEGLTLTVLPGKSYINGCWYKPKNNKELTLAESGIAYPRYDLIVVRWDKLVREIYLDVVQGEEAAEPVYPALARNDTTFELGLAAVYVAANASEITQASITDLRFFDEYCGVVRGVFDTISTTNLFAQYAQSWFDFVAQLPSADPDRITINTADEQARADINNLQNTDEEIKTAINAIQEKISSLKILHGVTAGTSSSNTVTFAEPFSAPPTVVANYVGSASAQAIYVTSVSSVTAAKFTVQPYRLSDGGDITSINGKFYWIAIGT